MMIFTVRSVAIRDFIYKINCDLEKERKNYMRRQLFYGKKVILIHFVHS